MKNKGLLGCKCSSRVEILRYTDINNFLALEKNIDIILTMPLDKS